MAYEGTTTEGGTKVASYSFQPVSIVAKRPQTRTQGGLVKRAISWGEIAVVAVTATFVINVLSLMQEEG